MANQWPNVSVVKDDDGGLSRNLTIVRRREVGQSDFSASLLECGMILTEHVYGLVTAEEDVPVKDFYLVCVLRAGHGLWQGASSFFDSHVETGFLGIKRDEKTLLAECSYNTCPSDLEGRTVIVYDVMLATAASISLAVSELKEHSRATNITVVTLLCAPEGIQRMQLDHPDVRIVTAAVDSCLDEYGFIVPGLGDAGDRLFGHK